MGLDRRSGVYQHLKKNIEASYQEPISKTTDAIEEDRPSP